MSKSDFISGRIICIATGASIRWFIGLIWRTIFNKKKYTFKDYLNGLDNPDNLIGKFGPSVLNGIIGLIFILTLIYIVVKV